MEEVERAPDFKVTHEIIACLPYIALPDDHYEIGHAVFWPASRASEFVTDELQENFSQYLDWVTTFRVNVERDGGWESAKTRPLREFDVTCISVRRDLGGGTDPYLADAIRLLAFFSCFDSFLAHSFTEMNQFWSILNADAKTLTNQDSWTSQHGIEQTREPTIRLARIPAERIEAAGALLERKHASASPRRASRYIRAIQYFTEMWLTPYRGMFRTLASDPHSIVVLASAFESLLDLPRAKKTAALKARILDLMQFEDEVPRNVMLQWVESFYNLRSRVVHGDDVPHEIFDGNPNVRMSSILFGVHVFLLCVSYELVGTGFLGPSMLDDFRKHEFEVYLWPEEALLGRAKQALVEAKSKVDDATTAKSRLHDFYKTAVRGNRLRERIAEADPTSSVEFVHVENPRIARLRSEIVGLADQEVTIGDVRKPLFEHVPVNDENTQSFISYLRRKNE